MLVSTAAGVVGAVAGVMQWLTSAGAWAVVAVGLAGLAAACWALGWLWMQRRPVLATVVVLILVVLSAVTGAATDRIVGRSTGKPTTVAATPTPDDRPTSAVPTSPTSAPTSPATPTGRPTDPTEAPDPSTTASPTSDGVKPPSRTEKGVTLSMSYSLDLDSTVTNWKVQYGYSLGQGLDVYLNRGSPPVRTPGDVVVVDGTPSESACETSVTRQNDILSEQLRTDQSFCVRTTEKRWAWLTVKRYEPGKTLTFDVIVW
ncbi:hypothetical protein ACGFNF_04775 [Micromonospora sp. NPDC048868]|uniref:hypothetical protein n=1 Tax=Micromonospora sp. NPDC048868 TaxID=3364258 RepID=UPI003724A073